MAKRTKKEIALTPEEKLQQALVPVEKHPYPVPANWCWTRLDNISEIVTGGTPSKKHPEYYGGSFPFFKPSDLDAGRHVFKASEYLTDEGKLVSRIIPANSTAVCCIGSIGKCGFIEKTGTTNQQINSVIPKILPLYLFYYLNTNSFQNELLGMASATTISIVNKSKMEQCRFPLPPLAEQQRIVARIESLFAKLDEVKEKAQAVVDGYEDRKAAILHKAFTGELTAKWREEQGINITSWKQTDLQAVCSMKITDGTHKTPTYCERDEGFPFISAKDITGETICWDNIKYIVPELHTELYARLAPQRDDILLAKNGTTGVAAIVDVDKVFDLYVTIAVLRPNKEIIEPRFLLDIVNSPICKRQFDEHLTGIGVPNLHLRDIKAVAINLPIREEQKEIVHLVDSMIEAENTIKSTAESVLDQIDTMKKAILARAFRGELGTNDPSDEPAIKLLKKVLQEE